MSWEVSFTKMQTVPVGATDYRPTHKQAIALVSLRDEMRSERQPDRPMMGWVDSYRTDRFRQLIFSFPNIPIPPR